MQYGMRAYKALSIDFIVSGLLALHLHQLRNFLFFLARIITEETFIALQRIRCRKIGSVVVIDNTINVCTDII